MLEEADGGVWVGLGGVCGGGVFPGLDAGWMLQCLLLRIKA